MNALDQSTCTVRRLYTLSPTDRDVLLSLYGPLIGADSLGLYLFLDTLLPTVGVKKGLFADLLSSVGLTATKFIMAREKLEAVKLLTSFSRGVDDADLLIDVNLPLDPKSFFEHPLYFPAVRRVLQSESRVNELKKRFMIGSQIDSSYRNISLGFEEVFTVDDSFFFENEGSKDEYLQRAPERFEAFSSERFLAELIQLEPLLSSADIDPQTISTVASLVAAYHLDEKIAATLYERSCSFRNDFSVENFKREIHRYCEVAVEKEEIPVQDLKVILGDSEISKKIKCFLSLTPPQLIYLLTHHLPLDSDYALIDRLNTEFGLGPEVIDVVIDATLRFCNGVLSHKYAEAIGRTLLYNEVFTDPYAAYLVLDRNNEKKAKKIVGLKPTSPTKSEQKPAVRTSSIEGKLQDEDLDVLLDQLEDMKI